MLDWINPANIITFFLFLGVLVFVHELGHFLMAKKVGVRVEEFGFGLPPRLFGKKIKETIYSLNWLPFGGFVRLFGEDEETPQKIKKDRNKAFFAKTPLQRSAIICAGVVMNVFLGWLIYTYLFTQGVTQPTGQVVVEQVSMGSPAEKAGILKGDVITSMKSEDGITYSVASTSDLIATTKKLLDSKVTLSIIREGKPVTIVLIPRSNAPEGEGAMGVVITEGYTTVKYSLFQAPVMAVKQSLETIKMTIVGLGTLLWKLVTFQSVRQDVAGPLGIGQLVGQARAFGNNAVLELMALLSFNLALLNILPFPALDGGRLLFVLIEAVSGRRVSPQWERNVHQVGMMILLALIALVTLNDILRIAAG